MKCRYTASKLLPERSLFFSELVPRLKVGASNFKRNRVSFEERGLQFFG